VPAARRLGIGLVPYSPLGRGLLTATLGAADIDGSDFRRADPAVSTDRPWTRKPESCGGAGANLAAALGLTPGQLALAWLLRARARDVVPDPGQPPPGPDRGERRRSGGPARAPGRSGAAGQRVAPLRLGRGTGTRFAVPVTDQGADAS